MNELKQCPFCGGMAKNVYSIKGFRLVYFICCSKCKAKSSFCKEPEEAITAWNKRIKWEGSDNNARR